MNQNNVAQAIPDEKKFDRLYNQTFKGYGTDGAERLTHAQIFWAAGHAAALSTLRTPVADTPRALLALRHIGAWAGTGAGVKTHQEVRKYAKHMAKTCSATAEAPFADEAITHEMIQAGAKAAREHFEESGGNNPAVIYRAMRASAPAAPCQVGHCVSCGGSGQDGDVGNDGSAIDVQCGACSGTGQHPDDIAVDRFAVAMKAKLAKKRADGRDGWEDKTQCSAEWLSELLRGHVDKGDPLDVGNLAMMLHQRGESIHATPQASADALQIRRDTLLSVLGALNSNPANLMKHECIAEVRKLFEQADEDLRQAGTTARCHCPSEERKKQLATGFAMFDQYGRGYTADEIAALMAEINRRSAPTTGADT